MNLAALRMVVLDLDDTLAESKSPLTAVMADTLADLLDVVEVCVISGARYRQFETQVLERLPGRAKLSGLHLMPTCGTRYVRHTDDRWRPVYAHDFTDDEKSRAFVVLEESARELGLWEPESLVRGPRIEDRGSQVTFSALGQQAAVADKKLWDPDGGKRERLRAVVAGRLPDLEVRAGGSTSVDITQAGIDKAYGVKALAQVTGIGLDEMLFIGDRLVPGGNDYPVFELGVACHEVSGPQETVEYLRELISQLVAARDQGGSGDR